MTQHHEVADAMHSLAEALHDHTLDAPVLTDALEQRCRSLARPWSIAALAVFGVVAERLGAPEGAGYVAWQTTASLVALVVVAAGLLLAWRWEGLGGAIALVGGVALGALAAIEYHPLVALAGAVVFVVPAVLFLLAWQRTTSARSVILLATVLLVFMTAGGATAFGFYQEGYGPAHPESTLAPLPDGPILWMWSGGVTTEEAVVVARLDEAPVALLLSSATGEQRLAPTTTGDDVVRWELTGLAPGTAYTYHLEVAGVVDRDRPGRFSTFPEGAASFSVAVGSCARVGSNGAVFDAIRRAEPDLFLSTGDLFYGDVHRNSVDEFLSMYDASLSTPAQSALYRAMPMAYVWDDHDYGPNDAAGDSPSREAALEAYATLVPHYPIAFDPADGPISQAFTIGRVRFILTDTRSMRTPQSAPDDTAKSMLGSAQVEWLKRELVASAATHPLIVWVNTVPWIAAADEGADNWGGYTTERAELADFIAANEIDGLLMLAGDAHMLAIDDGTNSDYSATGGAGFPVFHAAALDRPGSDKGGPYSEGSYPGGGQFGVMTVIDDGGDTITVELRGLDWNGREIVALDLTYDAGGGR